MFLKGDDDVDGPRRVVRGLVKVIQISKSTRIQISKFKKKLRFEFLKTSDWIDSKFMSDSIY